MYVGLRISTRTLMWIVTVLEIQCCFLLPMASAINSMFLSLLFSTFFSPFLLFSFFDHSLIQKAQSCFKVEALQFRLWSFEDPSNLVHLPFCSLSNSTFFIASTFFLFSFFFFFSIQGFKITLMPANFHYAMIHIYRKKKSLYLNQIELDFNFCTFKFTEISF